ncbi:unnamed protein product [Brassica oleracea]
MHIPGEGMVPKALAYFKWSSRRAPRCALAQGARHILHRHGAPCAFLNTALNIGIFASITGLWSIVAGDFLDTVCDEDVFLLDTVIYHSLFHKFAAGNIFVMDGAERRQI